MNLLGYDGVAFLALLEKAPDDLVVLNRLLQCCGKFYALFDCLRLHSTAE